MSIRSGIMSQLRPAASRTAPPGQASSGSSGFAGSSFRTPGPLTPASAAKAAPKTPTTTATATSTAGNAQSGTGPKLQQQQQQQAVAVSQQQAPQQAKVLGNSTAVQQPPQKQQQQQQQQQQQVSTPPPQTTDNSPPPPPVSSQTPTKPPTTGQAQQPSPAAAPKASTASPTTPTPEAPQQQQQQQPVQPVQLTPATPPLPAVNLELNPPSELAFRGSFKHTITTHMRLTNPSTDTRVCYKLRTTAPHLYCAKPSVDVIGPQQTADIKVILQAASVDLADINVKHKLMVQWISVPEGEITSLDKLWQQSRSKDISNAKLSCVLERIPEKPVENRPIVENGIEAVCTPVSYAATNSQPTMELKSSSKPTLSSPSSSSSGFLLVMLVVVVAVIAALLYNSNQ